MGNISVAWKLTRGPWTLQNAFYVMVVLRELTCPRLTIYTFLSQSPIMGTSYQRQFGEDVTVGMSLPELPPRSHLNQADRAAQLSEVGGSGQVKQRQRLAGTHRELCGSCRSVLAPSKTFFSIAYSTGFIPASLPWCCCLPICLHP